jgi:uncharacterized Zn finger protein
MNSFKEYIAEMDMNADTLDWFDQTCRACGSGKYRAKSDQTTVKCNHCGHESPRFVKNTNKSQPKNISSKVIGMSQSKRAKAMGLM